MDNTLLNITQADRDIANRITEIYADFKVKIGELIAVRKGLRVTRFEFLITPDTKLNKITMLRDDISLMLSVPKVRIICPIPTKTAFGIEIPNTTEEFLNFNEIFSSREATDTNAILPLLLGKSIDNEVVLLDLSKAPSLLIGGQAYSGKTNLIKGMITSLINNTRYNTKLILITDKAKELETFSNSSCLLRPIITDGALALESLRELLAECQNRQKLFSEKSVKNIDAYNNIAENPLYRIVAVIDEFSFILNHEPRDFEYLVSSLAQVGRAYGIHIILSTNNLSAKNITGIIKANIPTRIAFRTENVVGSRTVIDCADAECLLSKGDMLFCSMLNKPQRIQAPLFGDLN